MKVNMNKDLAFAAAVGVVIGLLALSYASSNNLNRLGSVPPDSPLYGLAQEIPLAASSGAITSKGVANSLASKVVEAQKSLNENENGDDDDENEVGDDEEDETEIDDAIEELDDLINEVNAQRGKKIAPAEADALIEAANAAIERIRDSGDVGGTGCVGTIMSDGTCCADPQVVVIQEGQEFCVSM